jgi:tripartite-type tricarboxylate transporter receptor subunit TctC
VPEFYAQMSYGLWAPARTPEDIIVKLNAAVVEALADPAVRKRLAELGEDIPPPEAQTPEALAAYHKAEIEKWWPSLRRRAARLNNIIRRLLIGECLFLAQL